MGPADDQMREQAALRRVAEAVARGIAPEAVFPLVASEVELLLDADAGVVWRVQGDESVVVGSSSARIARVGTRFPTGGRGAVAQVARTGRPARTRYADLDSSDPTRVRVQRLGYRSGVAAPVTVAGRLWGALLAASADPDGFTGDAEIRLQSFAELIGVAIANAEARTALQRRVEEHAAFARIATAVAGSAPSDEIVRLVAEETARLMDLEVGAVARFGPQRAELLAVWTAAPPSEDCDGGITEVPLDQDSVLSRVRERGAPARVDDYRDLPGALARAVVAGGVLSAVAAPVDVGGEGWGAVIATSSRTGAIPADAEERLARLADLVGLAITNAAHRSELESRAATDALTGLPNHRTFHERLGEELERAHRHGRPLSLVVLDIDHFKAINDRYGHHVGDEVLAELAHRISRGARSGDLIARVGGEEFAWILPEATDLVAWTAADRVRAEVAEREFPVVGRVTVSAGVADTTGAHDAATLYRQADGALYWAKAHGRNVAFRHSGDTLSLSATEQSARIERARSIDTVRALAASVDARTPGMAGHSRVVADLAVQIATALGWPVERAALLRDAGLVHDVGKLGLPDQILTSSGPLDDHARELVELHPMLGAQIARDALEREQLDWVRLHHARVDGAGYPGGLAGDDIPEGARILALAEAWDAMTSERPYAGALSPDDALAECRRQAGAQFCPTAVAALERLIAAGVLAVPV